MDAPPDELRERLRAIFRARLPPRERRPAVSLLGAGQDEAAVARGRAYLQALAEGGWGTPAWPPEAGGAGLDEEALRVWSVVAEEHERPDLYPFLIGIEMVGPILVRFGSDDQRRRWLEPIRTGREIWCQLFSEPEAGSDLAALRTRAERTGSGWRVRGHKLWVSRAAYATWGLLLARTGTEAARHAGLTTFALRMDAAGVRTAPIRQMNGDEHFHEVFLDDVEISDADRIGAVGEGWAVAMSTLARERVAAADAGAPGLSPALVLELLRDSGRLGDALSRQRAAEVIARLALLRLGREQGTSLGAKLVLADAVRRLVELARDVRGPAATLEDETWSMLDLTAPSLSIRGGTDEIQLDVIAERELGLPREPRPR